MDAVIYCRLSLEKSSEYSLENQEARCRAWATQHNHRVLRVYIDDGESGQKVTRAAFQRMRRELPFLGAKLLIVYDLDRFMRNLREQLNLKHELDQHRVALVSVSDNGVIDTSTPEGMMNFQVKGMVSEFQARTTGRKVRDTLDFKAKQGLWIGPVPFGYQRAGKTLAAHPEHAPIVQRIFALYRTGQWSYTRIAESLNADGVRYIPWRDGERLFGRESVRSILINPAYQGLVTCNDQQYPGQHPPLIDTETWAACVAIRQRHQFAQGGYASSRGIGGLLSDIARCAYCHEPMWHHRSGRESSHTWWYRCSRRTNHGIGACRADMVREAVVIEQLRDVFYALTIPSLLAERVIARAHELIPQPERTQPAVDRALIERQLGRLKKAYLAGDDELTDEVYQAERQLQRLQASEPPPSIKMLDLQRATEVLTSIGSAFDASTDLVEQRGLVQSIFTHVWLDRDCTIRAITPTPQMELLVEVIAEGGEVYLGCPTGFEPATS